MRTTSPFEDKLLALIEPAAADLGFAIVRVRVMGTKRKTLQIMAERAADGAMGAEDCARLSRALSPVLDVEDPFGGEWMLEVSSPGIDRPLTRLEDFARWEGFRAKIELDRLVENRKRFAGDLAGVEDDHILIDLEGEEETASIPFAWIATAKLVLTDALIEESLARRVAPPQEEDLGDDFEIETDPDGDDDASGNLH